MEKCCTGCGRSLPLAEFYRKVDGADGLMARCKACHNAAARRRNAENPERRRVVRATYNRAHAAERHAYRMRAKERPGHGEKQATDVRRWRERHPERYRAYSQVAYAVKTGKLERPTSCAACGKVGAVQAHHADYSRPLAVAWLCRLCHLAQHRGLSSPT